MQALRNASFLARLVLAWFALSMGIAVASPLVKPVNMELVCSGGGTMKLLVKGDGGGGVTASHTLDCPLCASLDAPPVIASWHAPQPQAPGNIAQSVPAARIVSPSAAPLPARGPPSLPVL